MTKKCWKNKFVRNGRKINIQRQKSQQHKLCEIIEFVLYPTEPIAPNQTLLFSLGIVGWDEISFSDKIMANDDIVSLMTTFRKREDSFLKTYPAHGRGQCRKIQIAQGTELRAKTAQEKKSISVNDYFKCDRAVPRIVPWTRGGWAVPTCTGQPRETNPRSLRCCGLSWRASSGAPVALEVGIPTFPAPVSEFLQVISYKYVVLTEQEA